MASVKAAIAFSERVDVRPGNAWCGLYGIGGGRTSDTSDEFVEFEGVCDRAGVDDVGS
jgi:hypothetical protein